MRKIINISIFAIAGLAVLLVVLFGFGFNQDTKDKFSNTTEVKANNPQMLTDLANATVETLPDFVVKYEENIAAQNTELKKDKLQCNIFYTFIYHLEEVVNQETLENFKSKFPEYSQSMFASATDKNYFINGFNKVKNYSDFQSYYTNLKTDYNVIRQNYLVKASAVKAEMTLLKQIDDINAAVSVTKKQYDLSELQKNVKTYKTEVTQFNITMNLFYLLFFATFAAMIIFLLWNVIINIKSNFGLLAGVGLLVLLLILGYLFSTSELSPSAIKEQLDSNNVKWIGAGLFTFYCIFFGTIAAIVLSIILNAIKKVK
ncbi:MAG: hypothetical protein FWF70_01100 [Bacteroidetes bacterium]|nr:hypothetical protein [Bacteroidota bacterium]MCL1968669.1 hypothetical protein [Bacteroidota bacterium]